MKRALLLVVGAGGVVAAALLHLRRRRQVDLRQVRTSGKASLQLLPLEQRMKGPPMSTITFFNGDITVATPFVMERVAAILCLNPWLAGWIEGGTCYYDTDAADTASILHIFAAGEVTLGRDTPLSGMASAVASLLCSKGQAGYGSPIFRVGLVPDERAPTTRFSLVVSMSHLIGDGATFYMVHNMLSSAAEPTALTAIRKPEMRPLIDEALGEGKAVMFNPGFIANAVGGLAHASLLGKQSAVRLFHINSKWVDSQKAAVKATGSFVSTNDVITSWIFARGGFELGCMAINFRGKLPGVTSDLAGNYESLLFYRPADFATAALVRASLLKLHRAASPPTKLPSSYEHLGMRCCTTTNWSTFAETIELPGAMQTLHLPLYDISAPSFPRAARTPSALSSSRSRASRSHA